MIGKPSGPTAGTLPLQIATTGQQGEGQRGYERGGQSNFLFCAPTLPLPVGAQEAPAQTPQTPPQSLSAARRTNAEASLPTASRRSPPSPPSARSTPTAGAAKVVVVVVPAELGKTANFPVFFCPC